MPKINHVIVFQMKLVRDRCLNFSVPKPKL